LLLARSQKVLTNCLKKLYILAACFIKYYCLRTEGGRCYSEIVSLTHAGVTEDELQQLSELLLELDIDNVGTKITLDLGGTTSSGQTQVSSAAEDYLLVAACYSSRSARTVVAGAQPMIEADQLIVTTG
jgi:hypothetical protein